MAHSLLLLLKGPMQSWGIQPLQTAYDRSGAHEVRHHRTARRSRADAVRIRSRIWRNSLWPCVWISPAASCAITRPRWLSAKHANLVTRYYLSDAAFVAALESPTGGCRRSGRRLEEPPFLLPGATFLPGAGEPALKVVDKSAVEARARSRGTPPTSTGRHVPRTWNCPSTAMPGPGRAVSRSRMCRCRSPRRTVCTPGALLSRSRRAVSSPTTWAPRLTPSSRR